MSKDDAPRGTRHIRFGSTDMGFAERTIVVPLNYTKRLGEGSLPSGHATKGGHPSHTSYAVGF
jgi:hypothetical protein